MLALFALFSSSISRRPERKCEKLSDGRNTQEHNTNAPLGCVSPVGHFRAKPWPKAALRTGTQYKQWNPLCSPVYSLAKTASFSCSSNCRRLCWNTAAFWNSCFKCSPHGQDFQTYNFTKRQHRPQITSSSQVQSMRIVNTQINLKSARYKLRFSGSLGKLRMACACALF